MEFSMQLYSLRDETAKDFKSAVKVTGDFGYSGVEFAGFGGLTSGEMNELLKESNLYAIGSHSGVDIFKNSLEEELQYLKDVGAKYMICPWAKYESIDDVNAICEMLNTAAEVAKKYDIKVGYHNHDQEFEKIDGKYILDLIAENTSDDVILELDVYWASYADVCPFEYIKKMGKKIELIHIKQIGDEKKNVDVPDGKIDVPELIKTAQYAKYFIVEQEHYAVSPLDSAKRNAEYLKTV